MERLTHLDIPFDFIKECLLHYELIQHQSLLSTFIHEVIIPALHTFIHSIDKKQPQSISDFSFVLLDYQKTYHQIDELNNHVVIVYINHHLNMDILNETLLLLKKIENATVQRTIQMVSDHILPQLLLYCKK